jgi:hypothetical protein
MTLIERLHQIADHDWRVSFLAHTSDTAREAADEIERLRLLLTQGKHGKRALRNKD